MAIIYSAVPAHEGHSGLGRRARLQTIETISAVYGRSVRKNPRNSSSMNRGGPPRSWTRPASARNVSKGAGPPSRAGARGGGRGPSRGGGRTSHRAPVGTGAPSGLAAGPAGIRPVRGPAPHPPGRVSSGGRPPPSHRAVPGAPRVPRHAPNQPLLPGPAEVPRRKQRHSRLAQPGPDIERALVLGSANVRRARCSQSKNHQSIIKKRISNHRSSIINAWPTTPPITASRRRAASPPSRIPSSP